MNKIKNIRYEIILFLVNAIYMILELIASRVLTPYFGSSNLVWTSVIGIILLSSSLGNFLGGKIADKDNIKNNLRTILLLTGIGILFISMAKNIILSQVATIVPSIKIGAIIATILLFFIPSMLIGLISPIIVKLKLSDVKEAGKVSGRVSAIATIGSLVGTFIGGFYLVPMIGSTQLLYVLSIATILLVIFVESEKKDKLIKVSCLVLCFLCGISLTESIIQNKINIKAMTEGKLYAYTDFDTQYSNVKIANIKDKNGDTIRAFLVGKGLESGAYIDEERKYELSSEYTKYYDLMFKANIEIKDTMMIGGAGYSYPKYYLNKYKDITMDVVEIDEKLTEFAKKYFFLQEIINKGNNDERLTIYNDDGRVFINNCNKKYDAILNDAFTGAGPVATLTTIEAITKIHDMLNKNGVYLTNIIGTLEGDNSKFLKAEVNTLKQVFKNVYVIPCDYEKELDGQLHNSMVVACDEYISFDNQYELELKDDEMILTDDYCPVDVITPII